MTVSTDNFFIVKIYFIVEVNSNKRPAYLIILNKAKVVPELKTKC